MKKLIRDFHDTIQDYCKGKVVLDIGCMGNSFDSTDPYIPSLSKTIRAVSKKYYGLDLPSEKKRFDQSKNKDVKMFWGDVRGFNLPIEKVDVLVAGAIIEHIDDIRGFFKSIEKHLKDDGYLLITTESAYGIHTVHRVLLYGQPWNDPDHIILFDHNTLTRICERNGFEVIKYEYSSEIAPQRLRSMFVRTLGLIRPIFNTHVMVICKKKVRPC